MYGCIFLKNKMIGFQGRMASSLGSHPESAFSCPSPRGQRQSGEVGSEEAVPSTRSNEEFDRVDHQEPIEPYQGDTACTAQILAPSFFYTDFVFIFYS